MVIPESFRESSFVAAVRQNRGLHLDKPDSRCHTKRVRREANGLSRMRTNPRFTVILFFCYPFFFFLAGLKGSEETLPNQKESQQLSKSSWTGLLSAWLDPWRLTRSAPLELGPPAPGAVWAAWPARHRARGV